jgi:hypothetical protein
MQAICEQRRRLTDVVPTSIIFRIEFIRVVLGPSTVKSREAQLINI